jgi:hypothetical protein
MKLFTCQHCGNLLYFENTVCAVCSHRLGYLPDRQTLSALEPAGDGFTALAADSAKVRFCANAEHSACNWLVADDGEHALCLACRHNMTIPDLSQADNLARWRKIEWAKHRLFYALVRLRLPIPAASDATEPLRFEFLADPQEQGAPKVMTGHDNGLITVALSEADDVQRTALRQAMGELYRTLMGHFRHEIGHYYWDVLVRDGDRLAECRDLFGDDTVNYEDSLKRYYNEGAPVNWQNSFISAYATMHPWEDFAETWAHYMHIVDTLETAAEFGLRVRPRVAADDPDLTAGIAFDSYDAPDAQTLIDDWLPLTYAVNSLNRSMGNPDLYPFVISPPVVRKLQFIHELIHPNA